MSDKMINQKLSELEQKIQSEYSKVEGMVILKNGETKFESYFAKGAQNQSVHVFSVTKSIISILIGIAIDKGYIKSVDQRVLDFFPDYTVKNGEKAAQMITLKNLLTMTAPFKYRIAPYIRFFSSEDWVSFSLGLLGGKKPTGKFRYMEMIGPDILSGILKSATGISVLDFARKNLFEPLSINVQSSIVLSTKEEHAAFIKTDRKSGWVADESDNNTAGWGLTLTAIDMAKIGQLYLDLGKWEGKQLVSAEWVRESTTEHSRWKKENLPYGYLWWLGIGQGFAAMGNSGNMIYVNKAKKTVVSVVSGFDPSNKDIIKLLINDIEPLIDEL